MRSERGQSRLPLVLMIAGGLFVVWAAVRVFGGDGSDDGPDIAIEQRCAFPACRAADNQLPARGYEGQSVVADPGNPDHMVVTDANMIQGACSYHVTFDRGEEWEDGVFALPDGYTGCRINGPSGGHVPMGNAVMGPSGAIYVVFGSAHEDDSRRESILLGSSADGGLTWDVRVAARSSDPAFAYGRPLMSAVAGPGGQDTLLVAFWECTDSGAICPGARFIRSDDGGSTFTEPVYINADIGGMNPSMPVMAADGTIHASYQIRYADGVVDLVLASSFDGGETFERNLVTSEVGIGGTRGYDAAMIALSPDSSRLHMVYTDSRTGPQIPIYMSTDDGGNTWSDPLLIGADNPTAPVRSPRLDVAPDGRVDIAFYRQIRERRDEVIWAFSIDDGRNFDTRLVTDETINRDLGYVNEIGNWYPPGVSSTNEAAVIAWSDTRNATGDVDNTVDVFVRRMTAIPGGGLELPE